MLGDSWERNLAELLQDGPLDLVCFTGDAGFSRDGGHWYDDGSLFAAGQGGRLPLRFEKPAPRAAGRNPYDPWTPVAPPRFVGRADLLRRLEAALEEGRSVSLVGDWRSGKSSLLATWAERQGGKGREVRQLDGEGAEGVSPRAFVEAVTGLHAGEGADEAAEVLDHWLAAAGRPGLPPLVLVDELDGLVPRFEHRFFERLRGMLGRIVLVVASRQELDLLYEEIGRTSPFYNRLESLKVGLLAPGEAEALIGWGEAGGFQPGDADLLRRWAGRHPFYLQLLGRHLVDARRHGAGTAAALDLFREEQPVGTF